jgi:type I restriction enzyme S subunit
MSENSWTLTDLGTVAHIEMGQAPSSEYVTDREIEGARPFLQGNAEFTDAAPRARLWCSRFAKSARAGDSLISVRAPVGELNQADQDYAIGRGLAAIRFQSVLPRYGHHQLALRKNDLHRVAQGSTFDAVGSKELKGLDFLVPPRDEQRKIALILDALDDQIRATELIIAKTGSVKLATLEILVSKINPQGKTRKLESATVRIVDGVHHTPAYVGSGVPFITVENLTRGPGISLTPCRYVSERAHEEYRKRIEPLAGDVLVSKDGTLGVARLVPADFPKASVFVSVAVLRPSASILRGDFLRLFFDTEDFRRQLRVLSAGSGLQHIHLEHFREFLIPDMDLSEQELIAQSIALFDKNLQTENSVLEKLKLQRNGLVADLLTGCVRVPSEVAP